MQRKVNRSDSDYHYGKEKYKRNVYTLPSKDVAEYIAREKAAAGVLHVEREGADGSRFVFSFNRTHETVRVPVAACLLVCLVISRLCRLQWGSLETVAVRSSGAGTDLTVG